MSLTSVFFFFIISSSNLTLEGSYLILITKSSNDFTLLSFSKYDIFSMFNCDYTSDREILILDNSIVVLVMVEKRISPDYLCMSI